MSFMDAEGKALTDKGSGEGGGRGGGGGGGGRIEGCGGFFDGR